MKLESPAALRNRDPILEVLRRVFPKEGVALEIASGSGEHARYFAEALPGLRWQPTDVSSAAIASVDVHRTEAHLPNLLPARTLDVTRDDWGVGEIDALFCANMIHIAPYAAAEGLMRGAGRHLVDDAPFVLYGPFRVGGHFDAPSNAAFDESLRARDPSWGIRDREAIIALGTEMGLALEDVVAMPANNSCLIFRRQARSA